MKMLNIKSAKKNEKGIALVFSLIFLSLLLILALAFALDSMFDQKAAYNTANASSAAFLAQAQLKQVLTLMRNNEANYGSDRLYSGHNSDGAYDTTNYDQDMLEERLSVSNILDKTDICFTNTTVKDRVSWKYIKDNGTTPQRIIGRTAFVVIPDKKIPLNSLVDGRAGTTAYKINEKDDAETRIGKYVSEINVRGAIPAVTSNITTITETLNWKTDNPVTDAGFTNGKYTGIWPDFSNLFTTLETAIGSTFSDTEKTKFTDKLTLTVFDEKEAFWADTDDDTGIDSNELYKRFDLTRNWVTVDNTADLVFLRDKILLDSGATGAPVQAMDPWTSSASDGVGLPWLACFGYKTDGTVDTTLGKTFGADDAAVYARRCQIAANLKDYCDTDNRPTSDIDPASWTTTEPTFTGNEKTPYINKIGFKVRASQGQSGSSPNITVWANIEVTPSVGLINIYGSDWTENLEAVIAGSVTIKTTVNGTDSTSSLSLICTIDIAKDVAGDWTNNAGYSNFVAASGYSDSGNFNTQTGVTTGNTNISVEVTAINITKIVLRKKTSGDGYDYTKTLSHTLTALTGEVITNGTAEKFAWFGFAVHDPRQNLHLADWQYLTPAEKQATDDPTAVFSLTGTGPYTGAANSAGPTPTDTPDTTTGAADTETGLTDPANGNLSTAFIRNAPMESPWELGFIHRGARWQTINLKTYDSNKAIQTNKMNGSIETYIAGGGLYADGDANILDQIKMTADAKSPQKMNLCSQDNYFLDALFSKIRLGCDIDGTTMSVASMAGSDTTPTGSEIGLTAAAYTTMRTAIQTQFATPDTTGFTNLTRASIVGTVTKLISANDTEPNPTIALSAATTDAAQEELIGKIVNLTSVGEQIGGFTIIILAQTIKDIGGNGSNIVVWKTPADGSVALSVPCQLGNFDITPGATATEWRDDAYGDEITAEQKLMVKGCRNVDGSIKIISVQYY